MQDNLDLNYIDPSITICPCRELMKHVEYLLSLNTPQEQLEYYNQYIDSFVYIFTNKHEYGNYSGRIGVGEIFYYGLDDNVLPEKPYMLLRQVTREQYVDIKRMWVRIYNEEINRLKGLLSKQTNYHEKLHCFHKNTAGEIRYDLFKVHVSDWWYLSSDKHNFFYFFNQEYVFLDLYPHNYEEIRIYNSYTYNYIQQLIAGKADQWLIRRKYNGFLYPPALISFEEQLERAIDPNLTIRSKLKEIETKYRIGKIHNYMEIIYTSKITDVFEWQCALLNGLINGHIFDLGRMVLNIYLLLALTHVEQIFLFYKKLIDLTATSTLTKKTSNTPIATNPQKPIPPFESIFKKEEYCDKCIEIFNHYDAYSLTQRQGYILFAIIDAFKRKSDTLLQKNYTDNELLAIFNTYLQKNYKQLKRNTPGFNQIKKEVRAMLSNL